MPGPAPIPTRTAHIALPWLPPPALRRSMPTATLSIDAPVCVSAVSKFVANPLSPRLPPLVSGATVVDALRTPATVANSPSTTPPVRTIAKSRVSSKICAGLIDALAIRSERRHCGRCPTHAGHGREFAFDHTAGPHDREVEGELENLRRIDRRARDPIGAAPLWSMPYARRPRSRIRLRPHRRSARSRSRG